MTSERRRRYPTPATAITLLAMPILVTARRSSTRTVASRLRRLAAFASIIFIAAATGCASNGRPDELTLGEQSYHAEQYEQAISHLTAFINEGGEPEDLGRAYYVRGLVFAKTNRRQLAYRDLDAAFEHARDRQAVGQACTLLGTLYYEDELWAEAAHAYAAAASRLDPTPPLDDVLFRLGQCYERSGDWERATLAFRQLARNFPNSRLASAAQRRLALRPRHFAVQCGVFRLSTSAQRLADELSREGLPAYVRVEPRDGEQQHVVLVGEYAAYAEAWDAVGRVRRYVAEAVLWP